MITFFNMIYQINFASVLKSKIVKENIIHLNTGVVKKKQIILILRSQKDIIFVSN
jgi:hypothetical protein